MEFLNEEPDVNQLLLDLLNTEEEQDFEAYDNLGDCSVCNGSGCVTHHGICLHCGAINLPY